MTSNIFIVRYTDGRATLVYFNGNPCTNSSDSNRRWSSVIEFVCDSETTSGAPELASVDTDVCIIRFEWKTAAACIPDVVTGDENVDYSELQESCHYTSGQCSDLNRCIICKIYTNVHRIVPLGTQSIACTRLGIIFSYASKTNTHPSIITTVQPS